LSSRRLYAALPNLISLARLLAVPVTVWLIINDRLGFAFWMFVAAGISDALDGFIAKHFGARSVIGGYLDPLADKALLTSVYVTLGYVGHMASWLVILVVFRDVLIIGGAILYHTLTGKLTMQPLFVSKINTAAQIALAAAVLAQSGLGVDYRLDDLLVPVVAGTTLASGAAYLTIWGWKAVRMEGLQ
jgi:cardiolipin synthase